MRMGLLARRFVLLPLWLSRASLRRCRIPPHMKPGKLKQLLAQYGEVLRVYCTPEDPGMRKQRKHKGGNTGACLLACLLA